jgi:hypothetical protein
MAEKPPPILMPGSSTSDSTNIASASAMTIFACRPTKSTNLRASSGRKRKVIFSGAIGLAKRRHNCISAGTVSSVCNIIMNMPTVRMNPNSASALKPEVASAVVATAAVRMQMNNAESGGSKRAR